MPTCIHAGIAPLFAYNRHTKEIPDMIADGFNSYSEAY
jgi:hypothetical protein